MNLFNMKVALKRIAGVGDDDPLNDWINAAMHEFEEAYPWPFLETVFDAALFTGSPNISPIADLFKPINIKVSVNNVVGHNYLTYVSKAQFDQEFSNQAQRGRPQIYTQYGGTLTVWPVPDKDTYSARVSYIRSVPEITVDGDSFDLPSRYHYTIVQGAAIRALEAESEEERAQSWRGIFEDAIDRHITAIGGRKQDGEYKTTRDVMGYGS
jgi:hypothetical protein